MWLITTEDGQRIETQKLNLPVLLFQKMSERTIFWIMPMHIDNISL